MPLSYGGVPLPDITPDAVEWAEKHISLKDVHEFQRQAWPGFGRETWPFPGRERDQPIKLGRLSWPNGAANWAEGHFLVTDDQLPAIRQVVFATGYKSQPLVMDDGAGGAITATMFMLPARQLAQIPGSNGMYLLTLVDQRYFWWQQAADIEVVENTTTWQALYSAIAVAVGVTINNEAVNGNYLFPPANFTSRYRYLPLLLDAVAASLGQRVVVSLAGVVSAQSATTALASQKKQLAATYAKQAGGTFTLDKSQKPDMAALVPSSVSVNFPLCDGTAYSISTTLTSLQLQQYGGITGYNGSQLITDVAVANGKPPSNLTELTALAKQIATDWYLWQLSAVDINYNGIVPLAPDGLTDAVWQYSSWDVSTRSQRGAWNDLTEFLGHASTFGSAPCGSIGTLIESNCVAGILFVRARTLVLTNGVLGFVNGAWGQVGCCACTTTSSSGSTVVYPKCGPCIENVSGVSYTLLADKPCDLCLTVTGATDVGGSGCLGLCGTIVGGSWTLAPSGIPQGPNGYGPFPCATFPGNWEPNGCWWSASPGQTGSIQKSFNCSGSIYYSYWAIHASLDPVSRAQIQWDLYCFSGGGPYALQGFWTTFTPFNTVPTILTGGNGPNNCPFTSYWCNLPSTVSIAPGACSQPNLLACSATGTPSSGSSPLTVVFSASATGGTPPYSWFWDFGDGFTSTSQSPTHNYVTNGSYTATMTVTDAVGNQCQKTVAITVTGSGVQRTSLGIASVASNTTLSLTTAVTIPTGCLVLVGIGTSSGGAYISPTCTVGGNSMTQRATLLQTGLKTLFSFEFVTTSPLVNPTITFNNGPGVGNTSILIEALYVQNLAGNAYDSAAGLRSAKGTGSVPNSGATGTTTQAIEYIQGWLLVVGGAPGTPGGGFTSAQLVYQGAYLDDTWKITSATGTFTASDSVSQASWIAMVIPYK
jgi:PKD repeat protein